MENKNHAALISASNSIENSNLFRQISMKIANLGSTVGIKIVPFYNPSLIYFNRLNELDQKAVLAALTKYLNIYQAVVAEGASVLNSSRVVWNALLQLGYRPSSNLFSYITDDHLIEIHDQTYVQVFRNLNFFNYCSYSLEDLYCNHLTDLYERDVSVEQDLIRIATKIFSGQAKDVVDADLKPHIIQEKMSENKFAVYCDIEKMAPLYSSSESNAGAKAILTIEKAEVIQAPEKIAEVIQLSSLSADVKEIPPQI